MDLGPWLRANDITIVSTVPTLVALWPAAALDDVRLLILGGEACPPEIGARLATATREVWNTYGPTEATVVACGARLTGEPPVRIGLPLDGWDLAVVDAAGHRVADGEPGELIIGGVGLARYLDPAKDAVVYAAMPTLGWDRAYRSGDIVRFDGEGLVFNGRADDQVKVGGRRIELGEVDSALLSLPGVSGAAAAVRRSEAGNSLLVGYVTTEPGFDAKAAVERLRTLDAGRARPAAGRGRHPPDPHLREDRPRRAALAATGATRHRGVRRGAGRRGHGGVGRRPLDGHPRRRPLRPGRRLLRPRRGQPHRRPAREPAARALPRGHRRRRLRPPRPRRARRGARRHGDPHRPAERRRPARCRSRPRPPRCSPRSASARSARCAGSPGSASAPWSAAACSASTGCPTSAGAGCCSAGCCWSTRSGRITLGAAAARAVLAGVQPGTHPRGGTVHLRLWLAERLVDELGATSLSSAPLVKVYARLLGCRIGRHVDLHSVPPVTGLLTLGSGCSIEPEVDLAGHWLDGGHLHIGAVRVGADARVGARSTLLPGADVGDGAEVAAGSAVFGPVPDGEAWSGAAGPVLRPGPRPLGRRPPAEQAGLAGRLRRLGRRALAAPDPGRARRARRGGSRAAPSGRHPGCRAHGGALAARSRPWSPSSCSPLLVLVAVRLLALGLEVGHHPVHGRQAWQAWSILRVLDEARTWLFPLYSSGLTPAWLRALGADIGSDVEASTVLMIPPFVRVGAGAFLADDTLVGGYELGGGWLRVEHVRVGKGAFVGNSGMAAPGRRVPKKALVAVLSAAPQRGTAKAGTSWLGSPPRPLRRERDDGDTARTHAPPRRLRVGARPSSRSAASCRCGCTCCSSCSSWPP